MATASTWGPVPASGAAENASASTSTPAPAAAGWGVASTPETSAATAGWGLPSAPCTSTESVQGTSTAESTASEAEEEAGLPEKSSAAITEEEQPDQSYDSGHGETSLDRSHEGDKEAVKDDVDEEIAALLKDAAVSPSSAESQPEDEAWLQRLMAPAAEVSKDEKTSGDRDAAEAVVGNDNSSAPNVTDDVGSEGSGTVTPLAERSHSPVSSAEASSV